MGNGLGQGYEKQTLYRVTKVFDKRTNVQVEERRMCGIPAIPYVPTAKFIDMLKTKDANRKAYTKWANEATFEDIWQRQETLDPIVGYPIYFSSVKLDSGWYRTSTVHKVEKQKDGSFLIETEGSKLFVEMRHD